MSKTITIAMDSFKGSMTSLEAGAAIKEALLEIDSDYKINVFAVADGGEGTVEALTYGRENVMTRTINVTGPLGGSVEAVYTMYDNSKGKTAIIEMAAAAGLTLVPVECRNPMNTTTYGVGEMIRDAIMQGCRNFIIGIGGSATNDVGIGMLQALGYHFTDSHGEEVSYGTEGVGMIADIGFEDVMHELRECSFDVACDVNNPLVGINGCSYVYAPQKGASESLLAGMDEKIFRYADLVEHIAGCDMGELKANGNRYTNGTGAAGGLGYAFLMFLNATLRPGIDIVLDEIGIEKAISESDIVITGEGRLDSQTLMGKTPYGVASISKRYNRAVYVYAGCFGDGVDECMKSRLFDRCYSITEGLAATPVTMAMKKENAIKNLKDCVKKTCFT